MRRLFSAVVLSACCIVSITASARGQGPSTTRIQSIVLEISIVEMKEAPPDVLGRIEKTRDELARLVNEGKAKLIASLMVRARPGESFSARSGQRVPIQTGALPVFRSGDRTRSDAREPMQSQTNAAAVPQIAYENTGLIVEGSFTVPSDGLLDIRLKLEMSGVDRSTGSLTPTFTQRTLTDAVRMRDSETAVLMGLTQHEAPSLSDIASSSGTAPLLRSSFVVLLTTKPVQ